MVIFGIRDPSYVKKMNKAVLCNSIAINQSFQAFAIQIIPNVPELITFFRTPTNTFYPLSSIAPFLYLHQQTILNHFFKCLGNTLLVP